jgi:hypothetical protein
MPISVTVPSIMAVTLSPNPANINTHIATTVTITETTQTLYERYQYCGVARCGGVI